MIEVQTIFFNHTGAKLVWTQFTLVPLIYHLPNVHYAGIFGVDHKFIAIKKSFVRDGKGTSLPIIGIYLAICLDKCPSTGQEAADERENNCYHFQLNEVIWSDRLGEDKILCFGDCPLVSSLIQNWTLAGVWHAHYADNYCHRMVTTNVRELSMSGRSNIFCALPFKR